jgi:hypothetical protein
MFVAVNTARAARDAQSSALFKQLIFNRNLQALQSIIFCPK